MPLPLLFIEVSPRWSSEVCRGQVHLIDSSRQNGMCESADAYIAPGNCIRVEIKFNLGLNCPVPHWSVIRNEDAMAARRAQTSFGA